MLAAKSIQGLHRLETARPAADVMQRCVEAGYRAPTLDALVAAALFRSETPSTRGHKRAGSRLVINHTGKVPVTGAVGTVTSPDQAKLLAGGRAGSPAPAVWLDDRGGTATAQALVFSLPQKHLSKDSSVRRPHRIDFGERSLGWGVGSWISNSAWLRSSACPSWARCRDRIWSMWSRPAGGKTTLPGRRFSVIAPLRPKSSFSPPARFASLSIPLKARLCCSRI